MGMTCVKDHGTSLIDSGKITDIVLASLASAAISSSEVALPWFLEAHATLFFEPGHTTFFSGKYTTHALPEFSLLTYENEALLHWRMCTISPLLDYRMLMPVLRY